MKYQLITMHTPHLICYRSEHGEGLNREYIILLDENTLQEVDLIRNTRVRYTKKMGDLEEYLSPDNLREVGFKPCSKHMYLKAQEELIERRKDAHARLKEKRHYRDALEQAMEVLEQPRKEPV